MDINPVRKNRQEVMKRNRDDMMTNIDCSIITGTISVREIFAKGEMHESNGVSTVSWTTNCARAASVAPSGRIFPNGNSNKQQRILESTSAKSISEGSRSIVMSTSRHGHEHNGHQIATEKSRASEGRDRCKRREIPLSLPSDADEMTGYQYLLRQQIHMFEVTDEVIKRGIGARRGAIRPGQVGIICRHCSGVGDRQSGAVSFPSSLAAIYTVSQNMANNHLLSNSSSKGFCPNIPAQLRKKLLALKHEHIADASGRGKQYWAMRARVLGVYENQEGGLRFYSSV